jgi:type VI secretion system protein ImpE
MTRIESGKELFDAGSLSPAIAAATDEVRRQPADMQRRLFLAELLCFQGEIERADNQLDVIIRQQPDALVVLQFRQVLRGEKHREECRSAGRPPAFLAEPPEHVRLLLRAHVHQRAGEPDAALAAVEAAEAARPMLRGECDSQPFTGWRDLDDLTAGVLEVLTSNGNYYWVPFESVERIEFHRPLAPRDLIWRRAALTVRDGPDGEVFVPALYFGSSAASDESVRLGRATDWEDNAGPVRGIGQRTFLIGDDDRPILTIGTIEGISSSQGDDGREGEQP